MSNHLPTNLDPITDAEEIVDRWRRSLGLDDDQSDGNECPDCDGTGTVDLSVRAPREVECDRCEGSGRIKGEESDNG